MANKIAHFGCFSRWGYFVVATVMACAVYAPVTYGAEQTVVASLNGTDITAKHRMAIIAINNADEDTYTEGAKVPGLGEIKKIRATYLVFKSESDGSMRTLVMKGFSSNETAPTEYELYSDTLDIPVKGSTSKLHVQKSFNSSMMQSLGIKTFEQVADNVIKPRYEHDEDLTSMPHAIYLKKPDDALYEDDSAVGLGAGATTYMVGDTPRGVMIGANERNSMLGGYGFIAGDVVTEVNGHAVHSTDELKEQLKSAGTGMVQLSYLGGDKTGIFQGYLLVRDAAATS